MSKILPIFLFIFVLMFFVAVPVHAQNQTGDDVPPATDSATATQSATSTTSATTTATASSAPTTLPESGAHDVLIISIAGLIFLIAGVTAFSGVKQVFNEIE